MSTPLDSVQWIHGAPNCARSTDPPIQVHEFDPDTFILRVSKCFSFEGNFIYLLFGGVRAILFDTGGPAGPKSQITVLPLRDRVDSIVDRWRARHQGANVALTVAHTHSHDDHGHWDSQFDSRPNTTIVPKSVAGVMGTFGLPNWPEGQASFDLVGRNLTIFPIPGHEDAHIATYDPQTKALLTGDMLYPGKLTVEPRGWDAYRRSAARLAEFARQHDIALVLGNHIEMTKEPGELYEIGTTFQPNEHPLPLCARHIDELHAACEAKGNSPRRDVHADFIIEPLG
jgi:glyoxylase-like metal-dependent hydrolase (beta-lactamase superfamily II)